MWWRRGRLEDLKGGKKDEVRDGGGDGSGKVEGGGGMKGECKFKAKLPWDRTQIDTVNTIIYLACNP